MGKIVHHSNGIIVKWEHYGENGGFGNFIETYELRGTEYFRSWYGDHTCSVDAWDTPVPRAEIPEEILQILGKAVSPLRERLGDTCRFVQITK